jgi:predicted nucleotidyltransferase
MKTLVRTVFGSELYGTSTPASDRDEKGVFMPDTRDILLGRIPKTANLSVKDDTRRNSPGELDGDMYSLHHFVKLACQGQTVAIDMLWTPREMILEDSETWNELISLREKFLSKNMKAFVGYARAQAAKYSLKGDRLTKLREFLAVLKNSDPSDCLAHVWDKLPQDDEREGPHCTELQIAGKWFGRTTRIDHVKESVESLIARYGKRANAAATADGRDWKALSHALRVSLELKELLQTKRLRFPLYDADTLTAIKTGVYELSEVQRLIDHTLEEIETLMESSNLPEKVDYKFWDDWLFEKTKRML